MDKNCYYRKIFYIPPNRKRPQTFFVLNDNDFLQFKKGTIVSNELCPGTIKVEATIGWWDHDDSYLDVRWHCSEGHEITDKSEFPFHDEDTLNAWLNKQLGLT